MNIQPHLQKFISPQAPRETRLMAAKAMLPMGPKDLITVLSALISDCDDEVSATAKKSLEGVPSHILLTALDGDIEPAVIKMVANMHKGEDAVLVMIALNRNTDDETLSYLASTGPENVINIIAENQIRFMRNPSLLDSLKTNPSAGKSMVDRLESFLISADKVAPEAGGEQATLETEAPRVEKPSEAFLPDNEDETIDAELRTEKETVSEVERESFYKRVQHLNVSEKIKLALLGNKEARDILVKDSNKLVSTTVLKNPRITEDEVVKVINSRSISDEILRQVAQNKEWLKKYPIKLGMVNNPKTPLPVAMRLLGHLHEKDVKNIAKSKNIPSVLSAAAKKLILQKEKK